MFTIKKDLCRLFKFALLRADVELSVDQDIAGLHPDTLHITPHQGSVYGQT